MSRPIGKAWDILMVWDMESGKCLHKLRCQSDEDRYGLRYQSDYWYGFRGFECPNIRFQILPDGKQVLSWGENGPLRVWDIESGTCLSVLRGHERCVNDVKVLPDGKRILGWGEDKTLRVWDMESGACLCALRGHTGKIRYVTVLPDGKRALSASHNMDIRVWDLESGECLHVLQNGEGVIGEVDVKITPDGKRVVARSVVGTLTVWDIDTGECLSVLLEPRFLMEFQILPDGKRLIGWSCDSETRRYSWHLWDMDIGKRSETIADSAVMTKPATCLGGTCVVGAYGTGLCMWDVDAAGRAAEAHLRKRREALVDGQANLVDRLAGLSPAQWNHFLSQRVLRNVRG